MSDTTFSAHHLVPDGRAMLACSCLLPDGWVEVPLPPDEYDFGNPTTFVPLVVCMAPFGVVVFTIAARPAFDDGTVQDWADYLATQNNLVVERMRQARVSRLPGVVIDATMPSEMGTMRSRFVLVEDGGRLYNIGTLAPEAIWPSVEPTFDRLLGSFALDEVKGITTAPMRQMTSEPVVDLSEIAQALADREQRIREQRTREQEIREEASRGSAARETASPGAPRAESAGVASEPPMETVVTRSPAADDAPEGLGAYADVTTDPASAQPASPALVGPDAEPADAEPDDSSRADPDLAGQPEWWRKAVRLEHDDRLEEAEQTILKALDHIGVYSSLAYLYEERYARLSREGREAEARAARERAIGWLHSYAASATSGGEGAALSRERDQRIAALGGEDPAR